MDKHNDRRESGLPHLYDITKEQWLVTGATLAASGLVDLAAHNATVAVVGLIATGIAAHQSNTILDMIVPGHDTARTIQTTEQIMERIAPVVEEYEDQSTGAKLKRLFGMKEPHLRKRIVRERDTWDLEDELEGLTQDELARLREINATQEHEPARTMQRRMSDLIDLSDDLHIHKNDLAGKAIFVCGIRRHGKTTLGARIAEQLGKHHHIPMFIPDLEGDYISVADVLPRAIIAGHSSASMQYQEYTFEALDTAEAAFQLGCDLLEVGYQVILDMVSYSELDTAVLIQVNIIRGMFKWANEHPDERVPACVYLDEAQRFLPQTLTDSVIKNRKLVQALLDAYMNIIAVGGKRGINPVILTQRFAQVNNKIMAQTEVFFLMRQTHDGDLDRCMEYATTPITKEQISKFRPGQGIYIASDGTQLVTQFHQRESSGERSKTPQADAAVRYASMPMTRPAARQGEPTRKEPSPSTTFDRDVAQPIPAARAMSAPLPARDPRATAIANMRAAHFFDQDIMKLIGISEREYHQILAHMQERIQDEDEEMGGESGNIAEVPDDGTQTHSEHNLRVLPGRGNFRSEVPESIADVPVASAECTSEDFQPGKEDLLLSELQAEVLILFYRNPQSSSYGNIAKSLEQIKNEKGQGLGGRYHKHASWVLEQRGLKKVKRA